MRKARNALCTDLAEAAVGRKDWGGVLRDKADDVAALGGTIDGQLRDPAFVSQVHAKADRGWGVSPAARTSAQGCETPCSGRGQGQGSGPGGPERRRAPEAPRLAWSTTVAHIGRQGGGPDDEVLDFAGCLRGDANWLGN